MHRCMLPRQRLCAHLRHMLTIRFFLIITCISLTISLIWIQLADNQNLNNINDSVVQEAIQNVARDHRYAEVYRKTEKLPKDLKYMLLWTPNDFAPFYYFGDGQKAFIEKNCSMINCYVTTDRGFFDGDIKKFDAVAFNGRNIAKMTASELPRNRSSSQKYIYFNMESADNYPICNSIFDNFFNWTSTYRLDSDIPYPYIQIKNSLGEIVGPKRKMDWTESNLGVIDEDLEARLQNKSKAVAWFVSSCSSRSGRKEYARKLQKALSPYGLTVDIYGACGPHKCPKHQKYDCDSILERDYYFYLSFENSFAIDYVTEKLLTAVQHDAVPIVFGGADYSRFLPRGSYLNARSTTPEELAAIIANIMRLNNLYTQFFWWKPYYFYHDPSETDNVCAVCAALNNRDMVKKTTVYTNFRKWWHPNYKERCT